MIINIYAPFKEFRTVHLTVAHLHMIRCAFLVHVGVTATGETLWVKNKKKEKSDNDILFKGSMIASKGFVELFNSYWLQMIKMIKRIGTSNWNNWVHLSTRWCLGRTVGIAVAPLVLRGQRWVLWRLQFGQIASRIPGQVDQIRVQHVRQARYGGHRFGLDQLNAFQAAQFGWMYSLVEERGHRLI